MRGKWFENFDFPIVGSKIKIVVNLSVTYQNLSGKKLTLKNVFLKMGFAFENFDLPIVGSIVVNLSVTYHNLSVENRNPMEKESAQSNLPSTRKVISRKFYT